MCFVLMRRESKKGAPVSREGETVVFRSYWTCLQRILTGFLCKKNPVKLENGLKHPPYRNGGFPAQSVRAQVAEMSFTPLT